jgi:hypothetical protein
MTQHETPPRTKDPFVYAELGGFTCSICAPKTMTEAEIEAFAEKTVNRNGFGRWRSIDISKRLLRLGEPTPNPCKHRPDDRLHWFLVSGALYDDE